MVSHIRPVLEVHLSHLRHLSGKIMKERGIKMGFAVGGMSKGMCDLLDEGLVGKTSGYTGFRYFRSRIRKTSEPSQNQCRRLRKSI